MDPEGAGNHNPRQSSALPGHRLRQRGQALDEKGARGRISLQANRQAIGAARCVDLAQFRAKVGARDPIGFESGEPSLRLHFVQQFQSRRRPTRMRDRRGAIDGDDGRSGQARRARRRARRSPPSPWSRSAGERRGPTEPRPRAGSAPARPWRRRVQQRPPPPRSPTRSQRSTAWSLSGT